MKRSETEMWVTQVVLVLNNKYGYRDYVGIPHTFSPLDIWEKHAYSDTLNSTDNPFIWTGVYQFSSTAYAVKGETK